MLRFQTLFVDNTNACEQRETVRRGQAEVRGREGEGSGEAEEETMKEQEFIGQRPRQGIRREESLSLVSPGQRF